MAPGSVSVYLVWLRWSTGYLGLALVFVGGGGLNCGFQGFFASIGEIFILAGGWALGYHSMGFGHFPDIS